jgi:hypothetical protein
MMMTPFFLFFVALVPIFFPQLLFLLPLVVVTMVLSVMVISAIFFPTLVVVTMVLSAMQLSRNASKHLLRCDQGKHQATEQQEGGTEGLHG